MASGVAQKSTLCAKCGNKSSGIFMCHGCQQSFCWTHTGEHRQELFHQMDTVGQDHDLLQRDMGQQSTDHPLFVEVDQWEKESILKIQLTAEAARADLRKKLQDAKDQLQSSFSKITKELCSGRESNNFSEIDLTIWAEKLKEIRQQLGTPRTIQIVHDEQTPSIRMIKIGQETATKVE